MNWVDVVWPLVASVSLVFGLAHLLVWWVHEGERVHLALAIAGFSLATLAVLERLALFSPSPLQIATLIRWMHVPVMFMVGGLVYTIHATFGRGTGWLAGLTVGLRLLAVILDFSSGVNLNFLQIESVQWRSWWGVAIANPVGPPNPALGVALLSNLMLTAFVAQTLARGLRVRMSRPRRRALVATCGAGLILAAMLTATTLAWALQVPRMPLTLPGVLVLMLTIGWYLGGEFLRWNRLEGLLRQSERRRQYVQRDLDLAALASGLGLWNWDVGERRFTQNSHNQRLLGKVPAAANDEAPEAQGVAAALDDAALALFARVDPGESVRVRQQFDAAIRQPSYELEYPVRDAQGARHWVCLRGSAEHDAHGAPTRVRGLTQDVSRRRSEEEQLRAVLDASSSALLLVEQGGEIRYANQRAATIFGYAREEMTGMAAARLWPGGVQGIGDSDAACCARDRHAWRGDGNEFPVEVMFNRLQLAGGAYVMAAIEDLTEKQRAEQEVAFERESMAHMSRVTLIGEISGSLAHELNQPLAAILSNAQAALRLLRRDPAEIAEIREILGDIVENDRRAGEVISRLRGLLRRECRSFSALAVNDLVLDAIRILRNDLINRGVEYRLDLDLPLCRVQGDPVQLQQVLLNLIINACDAMAGQAPRVLTVSTSAGGPGQVRIEVRDTGSGIPADRLEAIFAPFHTSKPNGMGMGLAICRTLLRAHGGRIWAANPAGGGARLCFELPVLE